MENQLPSQWALEKPLGGFTRLQVGVTSVGRGASCTIVIASDYVSRRHAEFIVQPDSEGIEIQDLGSTNGVFINDDHFLGDTRKLQVGDRIGIGVPADDDGSLNVNYPIYVLRRIPLNGTIQAVAQEVIPPSPEPEPVPHLESIIVADSDDDNDRDDKKDVIVKCEMISKSSVVVPNGNTVSENIQSIFGGLSDMPKEIQAIAEACTKRVQATDDAIICISSDDECDDERVKMVKSPQLFGDSFNNDENNAEDAVEENVPVIEPVETDEKEKEKQALVAELEKSPAKVCEMVQHADPPVNIPLANLSIKTEPESHPICIDDDEEVFLCFDELRDDSDNEPVHDYLADDKSSLILPPIKQEPSSQIEHNVVKLEADDDDEFDEDFESKVNSWSFKLSSQSFLNMSQIYEDDIVENDRVSNTEAIFISDDEDEIDSKEGIVKESLEKELDLGTPPSKKISAAVDIAESPLIRQWRRSESCRFLFSSSSSEEEDRPTTSAKSAKKSLARKSSSTEDSADIPQKKARLGSISVDQTEHRRHKDTKKKHSSTSKSRSDKKSKLVNASTSTTTDIAKLVDDIRKLESKREEKQVSTAGKKLHRSASSSDGSGSRPCKTVEVQRRKTLGNRSSMEEENLPEQIKPPEPAQPQQITKVIRGPPEIIEPPQLPTKKGKMRGVSAVLNNVVENLKTTQNKKDLKRKWHEKPSIAKHKEMLKCQAIKEDRKQKLKELADKKANEKQDDRQNEKKNKFKKNLHVKCTQKNRGSFLTEPVGIKQYKIPKTKRPKESDPTSSHTSNTAQPPASTSTKVLKERQSSTEVVSDFANELSKVDEVLQNSRKPLGRDRDHRVSSENSGGEQRERAPARQKNNKLTFTAMEQHFEETKRLHEIQDKLAKVSNIKSPESKLKKKKAVRFNDVPQIRYIERVLSATRKVYKKEPTTFNERKNFIRRRFPILNKVDSMLSDLLAWSQEWLQNRNTLDGADQMVLPITNKFSSITSYKNTLLSLLKIEYLATLQRNMDKISLRPAYEAQIDSCTVHKERLVIFVKLPASKRLTLLSNDLVLIEVVGVKKQYIVYVGGIRMGDTLNTVSLEASKNLIPTEYQKKGMPVQIHRIMEGIGVMMGCFGAVYQLEHTPLFEKIVNPQELINVKSYWKPTIQYKGCDPLNPEQTEILLKTYAKAIDEYNPNISLIKGPPGTGKSRLITNLALQLLYGNEVRMLDKKILICAQNNMAVDVIAQQLHAIHNKLSSRAPKYQVIRFGKDEKIHKNVKDITVNRLIERDHKARVLERNGLAEHSVIGAQEIVLLEDKIARWKKDKAQDVRQDKIIEMQKTLDILKNVQNQSVPPDEVKRLFPRYLENANIICTTLSSCVKLAQFIDYFDVCIVDEATQCIEPWTIMPLRFGVSSLIMVGDPEQLPATVISQKAEEYGLGLSLFRRIENCLENYDMKDNSPLFSLHTQYRMHPEICKWPNMYFYRNNLISALKTTEFKLQIKPFSMLNLEFRQNEDCAKGQIENDEEAIFVAKLVKVLDNYIPIKFYSYGIITPYMQHCGKLKTMLKENGLQNIMVNTIDSYQGIEKDVIIISFARTHGIGFLSNYQRLNVALTRPKKCLILCGNFNNLLAVPAWASLVANAKERGLYHNVSIVDASDIAKNVIDKIKIKKVE